MDQKIFRLKRNFTAGELSPLLDSRVDNERYRNGCHVMRNMVAKTQGPVTRRPGFEFIYDITPLLESTGLLTINPRMIPFVFSETQAYVLVFFPHDSGTTRVVFATDGGLVEDPASPGDPYTFEFDGDFDIWGFSYAQSADVLFIAQSGRAIIEFKRLDHDEWEANEITFSALPYTLNKDASIFFDPSDPTTEITVVASQALFDDNWVGQTIVINTGEILVDSLDASYPETILHGTITSALASNDATDEWNIDGVTLDASAITGDITLTASEDLFSTEWIGKTVEIQSGEVKITSLDGTNPATVANGTVTATLSAHTATDVWNIKDLTFTPQDVITITSSVALFDSDWLGLSIKLNVGRVLVEHLDTTYDDTVIHCTVKETLTSTSPTNSWQLQAWNSISGFPTTVAFFEQRIVYAGTDDRPQTLWFSKSGDYYDFGVTSPTMEASDACTFTLDSGQQNKIKWISSVRQLLVGTLGDEWAVSGAGYEAISFESIRAVRHTNSGGEGLQPLMIGPVVLFIERMGKKVNQIVYDYNTDSYATVDLSILAPHLTRDYTIIDWDYQQTPSGIVWAVREDGALLGLTFKREHNVTGWHRHDTDGQFLSVACIPGDTQDDLYAVVQRELPEGDKWYIERMYVDFDNDDPREGRFLDSFLHYENEGESFTTVSRLDHLEGRLVSIFADGMLHGKKIVVSGSVALDRACYEVLVGLPFISRVEPTTLDLELMDGTAMGRSQTLSEIDVLLYQSGPFRFGIRNLSSGEEFLDYAIMRREWDDPLVPEQLFTGMKELTPPMDWDTMTRVVFEQEEPFPLTLLNYIDHIHVKD